MKCPHCRVAIHADFATTPIPGPPLSKALGKEVSAKVGFATWWEVRHMQCPACSRAIIQLGKSLQREGQNTRTPFTHLAVYPVGTARSPAPPEVSLPIAEDYDEAAAVLHLSTKASAALSRRCLQAVLREQGYQQKDLAPAIEAALASKSLPSALARSLDAVRNIGNFAAHPLKDTNSGAIVPVEDHEAEWNLDVLEGLFDFFYVQPAHDAARIAALNAKLQAAGKPPIK